MPITILKKVWDYCKNDKKFLVLILVLIVASNYLENYFIKMIDYSSNHILVLISSVLLYIILVFIVGYGISITNDWINNGTRLPKINFRKIASYGIKGTIVIFIFYEIQAHIIDIVCLPLHFPEFDLEELLVNLPETLHMLHAHNPVDFAIFLIAGSILFYLTGFFMEVAVAKLADTNSFWHSFNLVSIFKDIHSVGWTFYAKEFTMVLLAMVILTYFQNVHVNNATIDFIITNVFEFGIYVTQFIGVGIAYKHIKEKAMEKNKEIH
ncbi:MAG: DUF4013 domain-containing protein [Methanobrevibacter thaueri]|uniref:DUF4013 domain-containing protein n=1 Tax=Methanobrevibacter thaueri TaxID=190975 RepID=UPI0026EC8538|nr:DUF4013 domain-containing protein [Methanobrevibacter thaueri]MBE6496536.1 DUF4013 domain-containing protein [Methanobrevibacter thaueri]